jgi:hypothetical protein
MKSVRPFKLRLTPLSNVQSHQKFKLKDLISAVEALCKIIANDEKSKYWRFTAEILKKNMQKIHNAFKKNALAYLRIYE